MKNRSSELYELFLLGKLLDRPAHGYFLSKVMGYAIGPFRKVAWGTLYPLIRRLQEDDLIRENEVATRGGLPRRIYSITPAGKRRFHDLMMRLGNYENDFDDWFRIRLANFRHISRDERRKLWQDRVNYMDQLLVDTRLKIELVRKAHGMKAAERDDVLRVLKHREEHTARELRWLADEKGGTT